MNRGQMTYRHLSDVIKRDIVSGNWMPSEKLPPARELAQQYEVNANTVKRALSTLEKEGLIDSKRTKGTRGAKIGGRFCQKVGQYRDSTG